MKKNFKKHKNAKDDFKCVSIIRKDDAEKCFVLHRKLTFMEESLYGQIREL